MTDLKLFTNDLKKLVNEHESKQLLETTFGECLKRAPLAREQVKAFLACHIAGVRDVPTSILTLAARLSLECMKHDYFGAHSIAAKTLFAATHEYGLQNTEAGLSKTHFELYRDAIHSWGFTVEDVLHNENIFPESYELSAFNENAAQNAPVAFGLGCHFALEEAADREFFLLWEGFARHWEAYGLKGLDDPALGFYHIHIIQEPLHGEKSIEAMTEYLTLVPDDKPLVVEGVKQYLDIYAKWLKAFHHTFFM